MANTIFYAIAGVVAVSALLAVTLRNLFHCALFLALAMFGISGVFLYLGSEFLAAVQVLIYVGAVTVLIIFGIMLTRNVMDEKTRVMNKQALFSLVTAAGIVAILFQVICRSSFLSQHPTATLEAAAQQVGESAYGLGDVSAIGPMLLLPSNGFLFAFEFVSVLLLAALVGAIVIARKDPS